MPVIFVKSVYNNCNVVVYFYEHIMYDMFITCVLYLFYRKITVRRRWCLFFRLAEDEYTKKKKKYVIKLHHHAQTKYSKVRVHAYSWAVRSVSGPIYFLIRPLRRRRYSHRRFSPLYPFFFLFCFSDEINQYVLAFWTNSMRIDHVQTIKHVPHSVYWALHSPPAPPPRGLVLDWKSLDKTKSASVIFLPVTNPSTHTHSRACARTHMYLCMYMRTCKSQCISLTNQDVVLARLLDSYSSSYNTHRTRNVSVCKSDERIFRNVPRRRTHPNYRDTKSKRQEELPSDNAAPNDTTRPPWSIGVKNTV